VAPVNRVPPEILALVPDFWSKDYDDRDRDVIALTHVCQAWREVFISRASLWTNLDYEDEDKTRAYFERSKSLPINLSLGVGSLPSSSRPLFKTIPHAIGRLRSLSIAVNGALEHLLKTTDHLSCAAAPLLEELSICSDRDRGPGRNPVLTPILFNGDLSSLRELRLETVRTELPWRNMVNLTSFMLSDTSWGEVSVKQLLDFFESAPHLRKVHLLRTPVSGPQNGPLVSLPCLEKMEFTGGCPTSLLLDHLLIPVGADLKIEVDLHTFPIKDHRFLDNLRNSSNFTDIYLHLGGWYEYMQFSGPNGRVEIISKSRQIGETCLALESLDRFDTSRVERLTIDRGDSPSSDPPYRALLPMKHLHTLILDHCASPYLFVDALHPDANFSGVVACPQLEELVIVANEWTVYMESVIEVAAARASRGAGLKSVRIVDYRQPVRTDVLELEEHVLHVKYDPPVSRANNEGNGNDEGG
jgi:hypothetical protein